MVKPSETGTLEAQPRRESIWLHALFSVPGLALGLLLIALAALFLGAYDLEATEIWRVLAVQAGFVEAEIPSAVHYLIFHIRLPRILLAILVGAALSVSGASLQALFRNPLADPGLVGVTSGAMLFTVMGIVGAQYFADALSSYVNYFTLTLLGFTGSLLSTWLVYRLSTFGGTTYVATMLLAGVAIGALAGAITGLFTYFSNEEQLRDITFWTLGSLSGANWRALAVLAPLVGFTLWMLFRLAPAMNLLLLGEQEAAYAGVDTEKTKRIIVICTALAVGACVAVCGMIGFIGLVVPHLLRLLRGADHRRLLPASALLGGGLLVLADSFARTAIAPAELPIGVLTALIGAPFFLALLLKARGRMAVHL